MSRRRGQAVVEVLVLAPVIAACAAAFAIAAAQLTALAEAEAMLARAIAADTAGGSVPGAVHGRAGAVTVGVRLIEVRVRGPLGVIRRSSPRVR